MESLKIGILGSRGIPNAYGGFEQFAQYISLGLIQRGHKVSVYNSHKHPYQSSEWNGVNIIHCIDWEHKIGTAGQFVYDYNCISDARKRDFDILLQLGYTSNSIWYFRWPKKAINVINMDGLEWKRSKYNKITRRFLKFAEWLSTKYGNVLIADSLGIQHYLKLEYNKKSIYIPYGAELVEDLNSEALKEYNLLSNQYLLIIARIEPENNIELIIQGYLNSDKRYPLIIIGNPENQFGKYLRKKYKDEKIRFLGAIYNPNVINSLRRFSKLYFHGHSVGGTNPSLLEAMACKCNIAAHDNLFNRTILTDFAYYFTSAEDINNILATDSSTTDILYRVNKNVEKIKDIYNWDKIIDDYEKVFVNSWIIKNSLAPSS